MSIVDAFRADTLLAYATGLQPDNPMPLNAQSVVLGTPVTMSGDTNTSVTLTGTGTSVEGYQDVYTGQVSMVWNRLNLGTLFKGVPVVFTMVMGSPTQTLYDWLDALSELHGVKFYPEDVADVELTDTSLESFVIRALPTSLNYTGEFTVNVEVKPSTDLIKQTYLSGFTEADVLP